MLTPWPPSHILPDKNDKIITQWPIQGRGPGSLPAPLIFRLNWGLNFEIWGETPHPLPHPPYEGLDGLDGLDDQAPKVWIRHCYMTEIWNLQNKMW